MVFISYDKSVTGHPENKDVALRMMTLSSKKIDVLAHLFGGQGTANVPCWSPDGRRIAFVSYQLIPDFTGGSKRFDLTFPATRSNVSRHA
jgi:Tol biopolymer transport system component